MIEIPIKICSYLLFSISVYVFQSIDIYYHLPSALASVPAQNAKLNHACKLILKFKNHLLEIPKAPKHDPCTLQSDKRFLICHF